MLTKTISSAAAVGQIRLASKGYQFLLTGPMGNSKGAYALWKSIQSHCRRRHVDCSLKRDAYAGLKPGQIRSGHLEVELFDPVAQEIEQAVKQRRSK